MCSFDDFRPATIVTVLFVTFCLIGCESSRTDDDFVIAPEVTESLIRYERQYLLGPGDQIDVIVRGNTDASRSVLIRPDGYTSLPLIGEIRAERKTLPMLTEELTERFGRRLVDPEVTVIATDVREPMVYVVGEVEQPQPVPYRAVSTAAQAIAYSGGFTLAAHQRAVALIRLTDEGHLRAFTIPIELDGKPAPYLVLQGTLIQPEDIVFVPPNDITQVNRFIDDHINRPLTGVNSILGPITNYFIIRELIRSD